MTKSTKITKIERKKNCTLITFKGGGEKGQIEIQGGMPEFRAWLDSALLESSELLVLLALKQWAVNNPTATDFSSIEGKSLTLDFASTGIIKVL